MRSRCHHRPLKRQAIVRDRAGCAMATGLGQSASTADTIAAASSAVGAGSMCVSGMPVTLAPAPGSNPSGHTLITRVPATMSCQVRLSLSHSIHR